MRTRLSLSKTSYKKRRVRMNPLVMHQKWWHWCEFMVSNIYIYIYRYTEVQK